MIHQELSAVPEMLVAENVYLGREPLNRFRLVDKKQMIADARAVFAKWQIDIDPRRGDEDASAWPRCRWSRSPRRSRTTPA